MPFLAGYQEMGFSDVVTHELSAGQIYAAVQSLRPPPRPPAVRPGR